jgi:DNA-binding beta-propeller fold protein YncE
MKHISTWNHLAPSPRVILSLTLTLLVISGLQISALAAPSTRAIAKQTIIFTDSQAAVLRADTATHTPAIVSAGEKLAQPFGICVRPDGEYLVTDTGCGAIIGINPSTGEQRTVCTGGLMGVPFGIAMEASGNVLIANGQAIVRVNPVTGEQATVASGGFLRAPIALTAAADGNILVVDLLGSIVEVDGATGKQKLVATAGLLHRPQGIAVSGNNIYVTDVATPDGNFGVGRIVHINRRSGHQSVLSEGAYLVGPVGISLDNDGQLVIADPYTINEQSADLFDGAIIQIDPRRGGQSLIARGKDGFVNPRCVTVLP